MRFVAGVSEKTIRDLIESRDYWAQRATDAEAALRQLVDSARPAFARTPYAAALKRAEAVLVAAESSA
jgi:hypothetical protein